MKNKLIGKSKFDANELGEIAEELALKKGIKSVIKETNVTPPRSISMTLRGGYKKKFEIIDGIIYEDNTPYCPLMYLFK